MKNNFGFITFINNNVNYIKLHDILIESILQFTELNIEVNSINFDYKHSNSRVVTKRINLQNEDFANICYAKIYSSFTTNFDLAIQLDADMIVTPDVINLFNDIKIDEKFILPSLHPQDPENQYNVMNYLGIEKKTQPYIHATYLLSKNSKDFLIECYETAFMLLKNGIFPSNHDETVLNAMLWKYKKTNSFVPHYDIWYEVFEKPEIRYEQYKKDFDLNYYICHGLKNYEHALKIFNKLQSKNENR